MVAAAGPAPWELSALHHQRLRTGSVLATSAGPLWVLVLDGTLTLETGVGPDLLGTGDAALVGARTAYGLTAGVEAEVAVADLRLVVPPAPVPSPLVVRGFAGRHPGVAELVRGCPLGVACRASVFAASYGSLIGAAMIASWQEDSGHGSAAEPGPADPVVAAVVAAVTDRPADPWTVDRMARLVHMSRSALGERFRRELGRSPVLVLREIRMQQARTLLADPSRSVEQIGYAVGYGSAAAFSRAFSAHHGTGPQVWRATSGAPHLEQREPEAAGDRARRPDEQRDLHLIRVDERPTHGGPERDRHLEGRHLQRHG